MSAHRKAPVAVSFYDRTKHFARNLPHSISQPARNTAIILWLHAHDDGSDIYLSVETLMTMTALPRRAQFRALKELLAAGYLAEDGWKVYSPTLRTRRRRLDLDKMVADRAAEIATEQGDTGDTAVEGQGDTEGFEGDTRVTRGGVTSVTKTFPSEPTKEPSQKDAPPGLLAACMSKEVDLWPASLRVAATKASKPAAAKIDIEPLVETWNAICGPTVGKLRKLTPERERLLRKAMAEEFHDDPERWTKFCHRITRSAFLTGTAGAKFKPDFNWMLHPENLVRILEGRYHDKSAQRPTYNPNLVPGDPGWRPAPGTI